jgi:hypothetical protein
MVETDSHNSTSGARPWVARYAFFPKRVNGKWIWREMYYWREVYGPYRPGSASYIDYRWQKEYGTLFDVLSTD